MTLLNIPAPAFLPAGPCGHALIQEETPLLPGREYFAALSVFRFLTKARKEGWRAGSARAEGAIINRSIMDINKS
jgi:hypothetical protein